MNIDYRYPAKLDNLLIVETLVTELKGASIFFTQRLKKEEQILCEATVKVACVDLENETNRYSCRDESCIGK